MLTRIEIKALGDSFIKDDLQRYYLPFMRRFFVSQYCTAEMMELPNIKEAYGIAINKKMPVKEDLYTICFTPFGNKETYQAFLKSMPAWFSVMVEKSLWQKEIHRDEVEKIVDGKIVKMINYGNRYEYIQELNFFTQRTPHSYLYTYGKNWEETYRLKPVFFSLPSAIRTVITDYYPQPEGFNLVSVNEIEKTEGSHIFNGEAAILQEFGALASFYLQGNLKYSEKGRPSLTSLRKIQRMLAIKEFYTEQETTLHPVRTMLLFGMLYSLKPKDISDDTANTIKAIFTNHFTKGKSPSAIANFIINQLKGIGYFNPNEFVNTAATIFWDILNELPEAGWVYWQQIERYCNLHFLEPLPLLGYHLYKLYYETPYGDRELVDNSNCIPMLQWPFLKGCIFLCGSYGLLEIAHTKPDTTEFGSTWFSEYDGLQALRLTALGRYVLGKTNTFQPPVIENAAKLVFDEDNLIIRAEGNLNLMATLLGNYVEKMTANRFAFRPALFLKDCKTVKQVENKISLFRKSLNTKLPVYWENALQEMVAKAKSVAQQTDVLVFKLNENDKNLLRTIAQDQQLKSLVNKAERFYVLVESRNKEAFKSRLLELGYLVEL